MVIKTDFLYFKVLCYDDDELRAAHSFGRTAAQRKSSVHACSYHPGGPVVAATEASALMSLWAIAIACPLGP